MKHTKIVCTIGPASEKLAILKKMVKAGMNVARLNFSHGTHENHKMLIKNVRKIEKITGEPVAVLQDLQGPKIRIGRLPEEGIVLKNNTEVEFITGETEFKKNLVPIVFSDLHKYIKKGERILLDDGRVEVVIKSVEKNKIKTKVKIGGWLTSNKGINLPDSKMLGVTSLTKKDKEDVVFGIKNGVDMIALSFVTSAKNVVELRELIQKIEKELKLEKQNRIRLIAKIERGEAVDNIVEILEVADGIMVARGDLGLEISASEVPLVQKKLINLALENAKPVIVATQMLDSMQTNPRPTRAEVSDVANAVIDHTDALMLSNETATGKYPVETVKIMTEIASKTEESVYAEMPLKKPKCSIHPIDETISELSALIAEKVEAKLILAASLSGDTGRLISRYRPEFPIFVATASSRIQRQLNLSKGVVSFILPTCDSIEELVKKSIVYLKKHKHVKRGDKIIVVAGEPVGQAGHVNLLEVRQVE